MRGESWSGGGEEGKSFVEGVNSFLEEEKSFVVVGNSFWEAEKSFLGPANSFLEAGNSFLEGKSFLGAVKYF